MAFGIDSEAMAAAATRAGRRLDVALGEWALADEGRLGDRGRAMLGAELARLGGDLAFDLRRLAARLLAASGDQALAERVAAGEADNRSSIPDDRALLAEAIAAVRLALLAEALVPMIADDGRPSLLVRLADLPDRGVAAAARALMVADAGPPGIVALSPSAHARLVWQVAAGIAIAHARDPRIDRALADAGRRLLHGAGEDAGAIAVAQRLMAAIDPLPVEVPALLLDSLADRRVTLFVAVLAHALHVDADTATMLLTEPDDARLPIALRAVGTDRAGIARVMLSLAHADPARDIDAFADALDRIAALSPDAARSLIAPLTLPRGFRDALRRLDGAA